MFRAFPLLLLLSCAPEWADRTVLSVDSGGPAGPSRMPAGSAPDADRSSGSSDASVDAPAGGDVPGDEPQRDMAADRSASDRPAEPSADAPGSGDVPGDRPPRDIAADRPTSDRPADRSPDSRGPLDTAAGPDAGTADARRMILAASGLTVEPEQGVSLLKAAIAWAPSPGRGRHLPKSDQSLRQAEPASER
jgi:hypothetical protein